MTRLLIISHDVVGPLMAGPGIRYWELARALAPHVEVTLVAPQPIGLELPGVRLGHYTWGDDASLGAYARSADVVLANGLLIHSHPELAAVDPALIIDLYDPILLENLEQQRALPADERAAHARRQVELLNRQLAAGDLFLCATERQRDLYVGALMAAGRVTPERVDADPLLRGLIDVVSFGLPEEAPLRKGPALRGVLPGIDETSRLLLWTGGLWDWMDPLTLVRAMPAVLERVPAARLVFLAGRHPGGAGPMRMPGQARALAAELGLLDGPVRFYEQWVPYERRGDFLLEADLLVSLGRPSLENAYAAVRSRFLDHLWSGRASLVSAGDAAAELTAAHTLGRVVPHGDVAATAGAIVDLLEDDDLRAACARRARALAADYTWPRVAAPVLAFCARPGRTSPGRTSPDRAHPDRVSPDRASPTPPHERAESALAGTPMSEPSLFDQEQRALVSRLEGGWRLAAGPGGGPQGFLRGFVLRLLAPLLAEQREFNATLVKLFYLEQQRTSQMNALAAQALALSQQIAALGAFDGELNDRVARLTHTASLLNDAIAAADEATARLASELGAVKAYVGAGPAKVHDDA